MSAWKKLGLIAGSGALPKRIIDERRALGDDIHTIYIADAFQTQPQPTGEKFGIGEIGKVLSSLKSAGCDGVVFAGNVSRPSWSSLKVDGRGARLLPKVIAAAARGDGAILTVLIETVEKEGMRVYAVEDVVSGLRGEAGFVGSHRPDQGDMRDIAKANALVKTISPFDIGQGAVVARGFVLAIEAVEGTDAMLQRCVGVPGAPEGTDRFGVIVKRPKTEQDLRVDLPVIGPLTVTNAAAAGLNGIAFKADHALLVDRERLVEVADAHGIFVYGFNDDELPAFDSKQAHA